MPIPRTLATLALGLFLGCASPPRPAAQVERPVPRDAVVVRDGRQVSFDELKGKVVVLAFFATWCPACKQAMPAIDRFARSREDEDLVVIAVDEDDRAEDVARFVETTKLRMPVEMDAGSRLAKAFSIPTLPAVVVVDREGVVRTVVGGYHRDGEIAAISEQATALLDKPRARRDSPIDVAVVAPIVGGD